MRPSQSTLAHHPPALLLDMLPRLLEPLGPLGRLVLSPRQRLPAPQSPMPLALLPSTVSPQLVLLSAAFLHFSCKHLEFTFELRWRHDLWRSTLLIRPTTLRFFDG
ncbi:hypothetical protein N431DRAFT_6520 [Stipitochalara longipes BDJ]|nr:hypothetical protein N431DRAFT_6520 [Stipitochalara longipes BDJ]